MDATGKVLGTNVVYPTFSERKKQEAIAVLSGMITRLGVQHIAIGNGTASRETEAMTVEMLKKHPNMKVLGHSQVFWSEISADVTEEIRSRYPRGKVTEGRISALMREYGNLYCDLSAGSGANALMRDPDFAAKFIEEFSDRILYGCDICSVENKKAYEFDAFLSEMRESGMISEENYRKIVRENAVKLLKL